MNTNTDTNLELFLAIVEDIEEPCEHSHHDKSANHGGKGEWYVTANPCPNCGLEQSKRLICDKFMRYVFAGGNLSCKRCRKFIGSGMEAYSSVVRKG